MENKLGSVLVIGAGIGGIQATIDLANSGYKVLLLDEMPYPGGKMVQIYKTMEDIAAICIVTPKILEAKGNPNVTLITGAKVKEVSGEPGRFNVRIAKAPRYVDVSKCITCGLCWMNCPVTIPSEFNYGLGERKAIYMAYAGAVPNTPIIDPATCLYFKDKSCTTCADICPTKAVNFSDAEKEEVVEVGAILLTVGPALYEGGEEAQRLGLRSIKDVVSNMQLERLISIYGPTGGQLKRPSDDTVPKRVGMILCVDQRNSDYPMCSAYCCSQAYKAALEIIAKDEEAKVTIFSDELCNYGKLWERVYREAQGSGKITFIQARPQSCEEADGQIKVSFEGGEASFDVVSLALPTRLSDDAKEVAQTLGLSLDKSGFVTEVEAGRSEKEGIFTGATATGPKEISLSVAYAEAAACEAAAFLTEARGSLSTVPTLPPEKDVEGKELRIGVFVCKCGGNISEVLDVSQIAAFAEKYEDVVESAILDFACLPEGLSFIKDKIGEFDLNRVVMVACSLRSHLPIFQKAAREVGLNPHLVTMVNAREAIAWTNMDDQDLALERVKDELSGALGRARSLRPLSPILRPVVRKALVLGGGVSGMVAATSLARQGFPTLLVEKNKELGGYAQRMWKDEEGNPVSGYVSSLIKEVKENDLIEVYKGYQVQGFTGRMGDFETVIEKDGEEKQLRHGVLIMATGAAEYVPEEYGYSQDDRVLTQRDLGERLQRGELKGTTKVFMLQCVGSRDEKHPYCSKVCCPQAVQHALALHDMGVSVTIGTKGMCTPGSLFASYREAKEKGVNFVEITDGVDIDRGKKLSVAYGKDKEEFDLLVLSTGMIKGEDNEGLSFTFGLPLNEDGFFEVEDHVATATPVEFSKRGIFVCGAAEGPKTLKDSVAQAKTAAQRSVTILAKEHLVGATMVSKVDGSKCVACLTCVRVCPYSVPYIGAEGVAEILPQECRGCGICVAACPRRAIQLEHFEDEQMLNQIEAIFAAEGGA
jgi:heterodisulfide reductase subunit A